MHAIAIAVLYQQKQFVQHDKLHLELDAVHDGLVRRLDVEMAHVLCYNEANVEKNDEDVGDDKISDDLALHGFSHGEDGL